ncbi:hypothetical protein BV20DRAFT_13605 [Pilatotrama ljubarskyi]|nr:hypothetical protein BV20DRAFT_13605 [Pilatotrama ljubarskyi]
MTSGPVESLYDGRRSASRSGIACSIEFVFLLHGLHVPFSVHNAYKARRPDESVQPPFPASNVLIRGRHLRPVARTYASKMSSRVYLGYLPEDVSPEEVHKYLSTYGHITEIKLRRGEQCTPSSS